MVQKIRRIIIGQLMQGVSPHGLALTAAFAIGLGIFPLIGATTVLCLLCGFIFKLNQPLIQSLNYILYPVQILFIPILLYCGELILNVPHLTIHPLEMIQQFGADWRTFLSTYGMAGLHAILAWLIIAPTLGALSYFLVRPILERLQRKSSKN